MEEATKDLEDDVISLEATLESLKRNAKAVDVHYQEARKKFKDLYVKVAHESEGLGETPLQPRTRTMKWLTDRGLREQSSFLDFFEAFVDDHKKENRLDLSTRTICLNHDAVVLFGLKGVNPVVSIYEVIEKLNSLYY